MPLPQLARSLGTPAYAMLGGALLAVAMPPLGLFPLAWVALVPLLVRWRGLRNAFTLFREAYVAFLLMAVGAGFWLLFHQSTAAALASGVGLLLLPIPHALAFVASAFVRIRFGLAVGLLALACNVLAVEYLLAHAPGAMPWLALGHTQATAAPFHQIADLGGVGLLTLFVLAINGIGLAVVSAERKPGLLPGFRTLFSLFFLIVLSGTAVYGEERVAALAEPERALQAAVVQPAETGTEWSDATDWDRVERLAALTERGPRAGSESSVQAVAEDEVPPALVVWPEAALPTFPDSGVRERLYGRLGQWSHRRQTDLLAGATVQQAPSGPVASAALLFHGTAEPDVYTRVYTSPLARTIPFLEASPLLDAMALGDAASAFSRGPGPALFEVDGTSLAPLVGYESLRGDYVREAVAPGADALVVVSASGWWAPSMGAKQHLALSRLRAIETRRSVLVAASSGPSALIRPDGSVDALAGWQEVAVAPVAVPLSDEPTLYMRHGDLLGRLASFGAVGLVLVLGLGLVFGRKPAPPRAARAKPGSKPGGRR